MSYNDKVVCCCPLRGERLPVPFHAMPQMRYINPMIQAEWMIIRLMEH